MLEHKRWKSLVRPGDTHHLAIVLFLSGRPARLHTHDFPEIFWIERGTGEHHINGQSRRLRTGDLVFVRPEDRHVLRAVDDAGFTLFNLAYAPAIRAEILRRHPEPFAPLLAPDDALPCRLALAAGTLPSLRKQAEQLAVSSTTRLALEHFLLGLALLTHPPTRSAQAAMPDWLAQACERVQRPDLFALGAAGFVKAAGRSPEHVARSARAFLGMTPSDYVNRVRMQHAARELRVTNRPITDIALECGLNNLSHFYALFRNAHGAPPRIYRQQHQATFA
jgi:AraC family cel operon transcriptional repressor